MSFLATRWAWSQQTESSSQKLVLLALADCAENDSWEYSPSVARLSAMTGLDRKTVMKSLSSLTEQGLISARGRKGCKKTYVLNVKPVPNLGQVEDKTYPKNGTGASTNFGTGSMDSESDTGTKFGIGTSTKNGTGTSTNFGTHTYQPINLSIVKETNKESFEDFDAPLSEQIENAQLEHCENVLDDPEHVLTSVEMVVLGKTLGVRLTNNAGLQEIANRKTLTVDLFRKSVEKWVSTGTGTGYLIGILKNASLNPDCVNPKKAEPKELTVDTITDKQAGFFASKLVRDTGFCCRFGKGQSDFGVFASKVAVNLRNPQHFDEYKPYLLKLGLMNNGEINEKFN